MFLSEMYQCKLIRKPHGLRAREKPYIKEITKF